MKKIILIAAMVLGFATAAIAQPRAFGLRGGELSYQHSFGQNFLEVDGGVGFGLGTSGSLNVGATGIYNFMIAQPQWTEKGQWGFYAGPAVKLGYVWIGGYVAVGAQVGLEYEFEFPLQLSIDIRPVVGLSVEGQSIGIYGADAILGSIPCLSVRYCF